MFDFRSPCKPGPKSPGRAWMAAAAVSLALAAPMASRAVTVGYVAVDLPDVVIGQDLWRYDYAIGGSFAAYDTLTLEFAATGYDLLSVIASPPGLSAAPPVQPDAGSGFSGLVMLTASPAAVSLTAAPASVSFVWLGGGTPGAQPFTVEDEFLAPIQSGTTVLAVPEPDSWALWFAGVPLLVMARRRLRKRSAPPGH